MDRTLHKKQRARYVVSDFCSAVFAWAVFFVLRKIIIEDIPFDQLSEQVLNNINFYLGSIIVGGFWIFVYSLSGYYHYIFKKTPERDIFKTFKSVLLGVTILFFSLLLDDEVRNYKNYYATYSVLFILQFVFTLIPRLFITIKKEKSVRKGELYFDTIIIGCGPRAQNIYHELKDNHNFGNRFVGYIKNQQCLNDNLSQHLTCLGSVENLPDIISKFNIDEIIIAIEPEEQKDILNIVSWLGYAEVSIKAIAGLHQVLKGHAKITNIMGTPLLEIEYELMPYWQQTIKKILDVVVSLMALIVLSPIMLFCAIGIKLTSKGPVFFRQERIGMNGKPFILYKFRSMYVDAEQHGPHLANPNDNRCTPFGRFLRRTKLDEIPNFINVLKGDMSLVGPRPERQYYIDQIIQIVPQYKQLQKIKPGITSLGQVRFGYASDIEQMVQRLRFDLLYLQNMSLYTDFLIIYYTIKILFKGRHF
ncbi:MAG: sugar transferase [Bacteroidales bacterium]|nr:sugar transferase [Bacteroidales bacterium]